MHISGEPAICQRENLPLMSETLKEEENIVKKGASSGNQKLTGV